MTATIDIDLAEIRADLTKRIPRSLRSPNPGTTQARAWVTELADGADSLGRVNEGRSLVIAGPPGTGKTREAYAAVAALALSGKHVSWRAIFVPDLYARMRPDSGERSEVVFREYAHSPVLLLDDLASDELTTFDSRVNVRLFNYRCERRLPTIITTNVTPTKMSAALGPRVASRLAGMTGGHAVVAIDGDDRRKARR